MISSINKKYFLTAVSGARIGKQSDVDIAVRCPICGDSAKNQRSTRLHLFHKNGKDSIKCFNGDCVLSDGTQSTQSFLYNHFPNLYDNYKRETFLNRMDNFKDNTDVFSNIKEEIIQIKEESQKPLTHNLFSYFDDIIEHDEALEYLAKRGFNYFDLPYNWYFGIQDLRIGETLYKITNSIIIPLYYKDEMYGFYSRNIYDKTFYTYNPEQNIGLKVWNWFNIDKNKECYIFEGIFDALASSYENIIALMGAKIPAERLKELKKPVFVLDNDRTGILNSLEYAKKGYNVYIQPNEYKEKDMNELMLNHPNLDIKKLISDNLYSGISAEVRLKAKL